MTDLILVSGQFEGVSQCDADVIEPMGVYGTSTFHQGDPTTPPAHPPAATSNCKTFEAVGGGITGAAVAAVRTSSTASSGASASFVFRSGSRRTLTPTMLFSCVHRLGCVRLVRHAQLCLRLVVLVRQ